MLAWTSEAKKNPPTHTRSLGNARFIVVVENHKMWLIMLEWSENKSPVLSIYQPFVARFLDTICLE